MTVTDETGEVEAADEAQAPAVVAVVVARDPGDWFEECLASLAAQDYPNISVLVIDAASTPEVRPRVAAVLPGAYVRRLESNPGYGPAANDVLEVVEGAAFYAFCHDDVILEPSAVRAMVEEAFRSNAGIAGPKLVAWHEPERLMQVGMSADKGGVLLPLVERGELDQEQHDAVRDVFVIPGGCTLVRADLFATLGGFDPAIDLLGEDLDLCWRAQVAGARVVVVPTARVQHRESLARRIDPDEARVLRNRHRLRTVLTCYSRLHLARVLPQLVLLSVLELTWSLVTRRRAHARSVASAWATNIRSIREILARRGAVRRYRRFPDSEVRPLQARGNVRLRRFVRGELDTHGIHLTIADLEHELDEAVASPSRRLELGAAAFAAIVFLFGTRALLVGRLPAVSGFAPFDLGPFDLLRDYLSGWRWSGLGGAGPAPTAVGLLGVLGLVVGGAMGVLQHVLVLGPVPLGLIGVWRSTRRLGSPTGRAAAMTLYAVNPLPWNAVAAGSWAGLLLYGVAPWFLDWVAGASDDPFGEPGGPARRSFRQRCVVLGLALAALTAFVPLGAGLFLVVAAACCVGDLLVARSGASWRALTTAAGATAVAVVLHLPWALDLLLPGSEWNALGGVAPLGHDGVAAGDLVRFATGPLGTSWLGWMVPAAGVLALLIGRDWRWRWAVRCWCIALACWGLAWAGGQGHLGLATPPADVMLAPAAAALALAAALGIVAFERDLPGYRFGIAQVASVATGVALLLATLPTAVATFDGRWKLPSTDHASLLDLGAPTTGSSRVLWLGPAATLPVAGFPLGDDLAYALTVDGGGRLPDRWAAPTYGGTSLVAEALDLAASGSTVRLGRLLAPLAVRRIVVVDRAAPSHTGATRRPLPGGLLATLARQLDLGTTQVDPAITVFDNDAWVPVRAVLPDDAAAVLDRREPFGPAVAGDLPGGTGALRPTAGARRFAGQLPAGELYTAWSTDGRWRLTVGGERQPRRQALGWANGWSTEGGEASLRYLTSPLRPLSVLVQAGLWGLALVTAWRGRRRRSEARQ